MSGQWETASADSVLVGDRVRVRGTEIIASRIETGFLGRPGMIAFIEDTPERWLKVPSPEGADVEVLRQG